MKTILSFVGVSVISLVTNLSFAQTAKPVEPGTSVYKSANECLEDVLIVASRKNETTYKLLNRETIAGIDKSGTVHLYRSNLQSTEILENGQCALTKPGLHRNYNTILKLAYLEAKESFKKSGPKDRVAADAVASCPDTQGKAEWFGWYPELDKEGRNAKAFGGSAP